MFLKQIHVENFRLLMNYDVTLDEELTLFVGKNNAGKTSLMNIMSMVVNGNELKYDDYPIQCRHKLYEAGYSRLHMACTCVSQSGSIRPSLSSPAIVCPAIYSFKMRSCGASTARSRGIGIPSLRSVS